MVFVYPLHPNACAEGVFAFGEAQVIRQAVVFPAAKKGVVAGRRRDRRRGDRGRAASDDNLAGITPRKIHQVCRDCRPGTVGFGDRGRSRTNPPQRRGIDDSGGENMRLLQTERLVA